MGTYHLSRGVVCFAYIQQQQQTDHTVLLRITCDKRHVMWM